jgi:hypothetical protein
MAGYLVIPQARLLARIVTQACFPRLDDGLGAVSHLQLIEDVRDMIAHGFRRDFQARTDVLVIQPLRNEMQDFTFAFRQIRERRWLLVVEPDVAEVTEQARDAIGDG